MYKSFSFFDPAFVGKTTLSLASGLISTSSDPFDACGLLLDEEVFISNVSGPPGSETITVTSVIYTNPGGTIPFTGSGEFYLVNISGSGVSTSARVAGSGEITGSPSLC